MATKKSKGTIKVAFGDFLKKALSHKKGLLYWKTESTKIGKEIIYGN